LALECAERFEVGIGEIDGVLTVGSYTRAAANLGVSTSSISAQVQALERRFGVALLTRTTRRMSLTDGVG
jgi:DNA-binding transcriptional LysR family regulator